MPPFHLQCLVSSALRLKTSQAAAVLGWMSSSPREACRIHLKDELPLNHDPRQVIAAFRATVNMSPEEVEAWLGTHESREAVERAAEEADKEGRHVARRIVELLCKDDELYYEADLLHMHQITQYINCHRSVLEQQPASQIDPLDAYHLHNFGFDPFKAAAPAGVDV